MALSGSPEHWGPKEKGQALACGNQMPPLPLRGSVCKSQPLLPQLAQVEPFARPQGEGGESLPLSLSSLACLPVPEAACCLLG